MCVVRYEMRNTREKERHDFYVELEKILGGREFTIVRKLQELQELFCQSLSVLGLIRRNENFRRNKKSRGKSLLLFGRKGLFMLD